MNMKFGIGVVIAIVLQISTTLFGGLHNRHKQSKH